MSRPARVLAIGWFGEGNLGDDAMLDGLLHVLGRALGPTKATATSATPEVTAKRYGTAAIRQQSPERSGFRNLPLLRASLAADLVTLGGGDLLREQADGVVPALNWLSRLRVPLRLRRPVALVGVSVGELTTPRVVDEVRGYLERIELVAARDAASATRLRELGAREVVQIGDLALEALERLPAAPRAMGAPPRIGVATRGIHGRGPSVAKDAGARLQGSLAGALDRVVAETGATIELLPFRAKPGVRDDDTRAGDALAAAATTGGRWVRHEPPSTAADFGRLAAGLDLVVSVRLHGAVLGAAAGRPVLALAYDPKTTGFLDDLGVPEQALSLDARADEIADAILRSLADTELAARVILGVERARARTRALEPRLAGVARR